MMSWQLPIAPICQNASFIEAKGCEFISFHAIMNCDWSFYGDEPGCLPGSSPPRLQCKIIVLFDLFPLFLPLAVQFCKCYAVAVSSTDRRKA